jgi:hypothetical protein
MNEKELACHNELSKYLVGYALANNISVQKMFDTLIIFAASMISDEADEEDLRTLSSRFYHICLSGNKVMKEMKNG